MLLCLVLMFSCLALIPFVPRDYTRKTTTGGPIEARCLAMGAHKVQSLSVAAEEPARKITCFYPEELLQHTRRWPVVVFVNGTGVMPAKYDTLFRHLASWGFIVIGNDDPSTWSGKSADMTLEWLLNEDSLEGSIFHNKVDTGRIGISGHSQGGFGVVNAITQCNNKDMYKAAVILSCNAKPNPGLGWTANASLVQASTMIVGSTGGVDKVLAPIASLLELYGQIPDGVTKTLARRVKIDHGQSLYSADGYVTAWFLWHLQDDGEAAKAFAGDHPELLENKLYTDQKINIPIE